MLNETCNWRQELLQDVPVVVNLQLFPLDTLVHVFFGAVGHVTEIRFFTSFYNWLANDVRDERIDKLSISFAFLLLPEGYSHMGKCL
jgi:hypothetical protein